MTILKNKTALLFAATILFVSILILSSCTTSDGDENSQSPDGSNAAAQLQTVEGVDGYLVYISMCSPCHGVNRQGGVGPSLEEDMNIEFLIQWLPVHRTGVDMDPRLEGVLINWLYDNSTPSGTALNDSYQIFIQSCAMCHGATRDGGDGGPSITLENLSKFDDEFLRVFLKGHFSGVTLSDAQRDHLAYWLTVPPQAPPNLDTPEGITNYYCGGCHPGDGPALFEGSVGGTTASVIVFINSHLPGVPVDHLKEIAAWLAFGQ